MAWTCWLFDGYLYRFQYGIEMECFITIFFINSVQKKVFLEPHCTCGIEQLLWGVIDPTFFVSLVILKLIAT